MVEKASKKVIFICHRYPMLRMVYQRDRTMIIDGEVVKTPQEYIGFVKTMHGGRYETSDPKKIAWLREQPQYLEGLIVEINESDLTKALADEQREADAHPVHVGMSGTMPRAEPAHKAPESPAPVAVGAVKVPIVEPQPQEEVASPW